MSGTEAFTGQPDFDPGHIFIKSVPSMVDQARLAARIDAHSYRGFRVGAAAFAFNPETHEAGIMAAGNLKNKRQTKVCAERKVLEAAKKAGYTQVGGLVVAGTTDIEEIKEVNWVGAQTLHPCTECQGLFHDHPLMRADTPILSTGLDVDKYQVHTSRQLYEMYASDDIVDLEAEQTVFGFDGRWDQRVGIYDHLAMAERGLPESERRPMGKLVQMALMTSL